MKTKTIWLAALAPLAILLISGTVFAEGEVPPAVPDEPAVAVEAPPPAEPEPEALTTEPAAIEEAPVAEEAVIEEPVATNIAPEPVDEVLIAEETLPVSEELPVLVETPVLVDAAGEPLVLATEETADLLIAPDPYFYVGTTLYSFTAADCNPDIAGNQPCANPLLAAINYIDVNALVPDDGFLYVEKATYSGNIVIDYTARPNLSSLTGLIGVQSGGLYPTIIGSLTLLNLTDGFTLTSFNITGGTLIQNSAGQFVIDAVSTNLTMNNVNASGSDGDGININNHKGNIIMHHVTSNSNINGGRGVYVEKQLSGTITIDQGSQFNGNASDGFYLISVGNVTINNVTTNDNADYGMRIQTPATVTLTSVMANSNGKDGIMVYYQPVPGTTINGSIININGAVAHENDLNGIFVRSRGATLKNIAVNGNDLNGLVVDILSGNALLENVVANCNGTYCDTALIDNNVDDLEFGVRIYASTPTTGAVTINNITAEGNEDGGIHSNTFGTVTATNISTDNNANGSGTSILTNGSVTITGLGAFGNAFNGLSVRTKGAITITNIFAGKNEYSGVDLDNCLLNGTVCLGTGSIQVKNITGKMSDLSGNSHFGLWAVSKGTITVTNLNANNNGSDGVFLTNRFGGSIAVITVNTLGAVRNNFSDNGWNDAYDPANDLDPDNDYYMSLFNGLSALSAGNISVTNSDAHKNQNSGGGIYLDSKFSTAPRTISLTNSNTGENDWGGVVIYSRGGITLNNVSANRNGFWGGFVIDGCLDWVNGVDGICAGVGTVSLTNIHAHENSGNGIEVFSKGTITLNGANADNNWNTGISLNNKFSGTTAGVSLTNINANDNNATGLSVTTNGSATLASINTHNNAKRNGYIDVNQTVQDFFNQNYGPDMWWFDGEPGTTYNFKLQADALWNLNRADFDPWIELYDADYPETPLSLSSSLVCEENNYCSFSFDPIDFSYTEAHKFFVRLGSNTNDGFYHLSMNDPVPDDSTNMFWVSGAGISAGGSITVRGINSSNNSLVGLGATVMGNGSITLSNLQIQYNGSEGVYLTCGQNPADFNDSGFGTGSISLSGSNDISGNGWDGLIMATSGNVTLSSLEASKNGQATGSGGILIRDDHAAKAVTLSSINVGENGAWGLRLIATGNVALTNTNSWNNPNGGFFVDNCLDNFNGIDDICFGVGTVGLTNINAHDNSGNGIEVISKGTITLNGANANNNNDMGINLVNNFSGSTAGVTLTNINAYNNNNTGLSVTTNGSATLTNINTHNNAKRNGWINSGEMVQDFYNAYGWYENSDMWWFEAENGANYEIRLDADAFNSLNREDFFPLIELYDSEDWETPIALPPASCNDLFCVFTFSQTTYVDPHQYFVRVGSTENGSDFNGASGFYRLSINDINQTNPPDQVYWVNGTSVDAGGSVTVRGINSSNNSLTGLSASVRSNGNITLSNLQINDNGTEGVYLTCGHAIDWSNSGFGTGTITLSGSNYINNNPWDGLVMATSGNVTLGNLEASRNGQPTGSSGISIRDDHAAKAVTLSGINVGENGAWGLRLIATGNVALTNTNAWNNPNGGIFVDNCLDNFNGTDDICFGTGTVGLTTVDSSDNQGKGIEIYSKGLITLSGVQANGNWDGGIFATNDFSLATAGITLSTVRADNNNNTGILVWTNGALLLSNINANSNALVWGGVDTHTTYQNFFNTNKGPDHWWIEVEDNSTITLKLWADGWNGSEWLNRWDFDPFLKVFDEDGNEITTNQVITYQYDGADLNTDFYQIVWTPGTGEGGRYYLEVSSDNSASGFYRLSVDDSDPSDPTIRWVDGLSYLAGGSVALSGTNNFNDNEQAGLIGWNNGNVTLANIVAWGNGCEGIYLDNTGGSGNILINGTNASGANGWEGLRINTNGTLSLSNMEANHNGQDGIRIAAHGALKAVTLTNIAAMWNGISGIDMEGDGGTHGLTTLNNVRAWFNNVDGALVDTNGYRLTLLNSSFICNNDDGFVYWWYNNTPPMLPFVFTNTNNIFLGNGDKDLLIE